MGHLQKPACPTPAGTPNPAPPTLLGAVPGACVHFSTSGPSLMLSSTWRALSPALFSRASSLTYPARAQAQPNALVPSPCRTGRLCRTPGGCRGLRLEEWKSTLPLGGHPFCGTGGEKRCLVGRARGLRALWSVFQKSLRSSRFKRQGEAVRSLGLGPGNLAV